MIYTINITKFKKMKTIYLNSEVEMIANMSFS